MNASGNFSNVAGARGMQRLEDAKGELLRLGHQLEEYITDDVARLVSDILGDFESHVCQIAFIGQMKAGKSSLINALIGKPDLLPTDINPSTAVVTKVSFGAQAEQQTSARFHFFNDREWERLMCGGRFSAVTGELSVLSAARVSEELDRLRERAERRLGKDYASLLGKHHLFSAVTPQHIGQYVSAGDYVAAEADDGTPENYSDITKLAEIFIEGQPFRYPAVIIDTPGVNDPFSVRDEITHANVADADIYVVVLTAQQPLSEADMALLRMLHGLQKRRIIVVINRLDMSNYDSEDAERVIKYVRNALARELPQMDIPVLACSAYWANSALASDGADLKPLLTPAFWRTAEGLGLVTGEEIEAFRADGQLPATPVSELLILCSGIPVIIDVMMRLIDDTVAGERLLPYTASLGAVADNTMNSMRYGLRLLQPKQAQMLISSGASKEEALGPISQRNLAKLDEMRGQIETALSACVSECSAFATDELHKFEKNMRLAVQLFSKRQRDMLDVKLNDRELFRYFMRETLILRSALAQDFLRSFATTQKRLTASFGECEEAIRGITGGVLPELEPVLRFGETASTSEPVSTLPLSKVTIFDMQDFWQPIISQYRSRAASSREDLTKLIEAEFLNLVTELFAIADDKLQQGISDNARRLKIMSLSAIYPITAQLREAVGVNGPGAEQPQPDATGKTSWPEFLSQWLEKIDRCELIAAKIGKVQRLHRAF